MELFDDVAEGAVSFGLEGSWCHEAHEMLVDAAGQRGDWWGELVVRFRNHRLGDERTWRARWIRRRAVPERMVSLGLLERLEELAHIPSIARAARTSGRGRRGSPSSRYRTTCFT